LTIWLHYIDASIKSRADALTNLPNPARWCPEREMWPRTANNGSNSQIASALLRKLKEGI